MYSIRVQLFGLLLQYLPYLLLSWLYAALIDGTAKQFFVGLGVLFAVRIAFEFIDFLGHGLAWHLNGKSATVQAYAEQLATCAFPMRLHKEEKADDYLFRVRHEPGIPTEARNLALSIDSALVTAESLSFTVPSRMRAAWHAALEVYSPPESAPPRASTQAR